MNDEIKIEEKLREFFEANYEYLKESSGHSINELMKERAFEQVLIYWKKHRQMILDGKVSSMQISVPNLRTPNKAIPYSIEGMIDVLEKDGKRSLFDVTTNSREQIEDDIDLYKDELNLYAYELERMKESDIGGTFVLSTSMPRDVRYALKNGNASELEHALANWNPIVPVQHSHDVLESAVKKVGEVVEKIQNCEFDPPSPSVLKKEFKDGRTFCSHICENCDIRKSCEAFKGV